MGLRISTTTKMMLPRRSHRPAFRSGKRIAVTLNIKSLTCRRPILFCNLTRQYAQRSHVWKLQYIAELEGRVQALKSEGVEVSTEMEFLTQ